jgi:uncharacterized protein YecT (DUF1311 family)
VRKTTLALLTAATVGLFAGGPLANPIMECGVMTEGAADLHDCLSGQLEVSDGAMSEALKLARADAQELDRARGGDAAVLAIEASQHAWEAYRDTECQAHTIFAGGEAGDRYQLACAIELTRDRTEALLRLAAPRRAD